MRNIISSFFLMFSVVFASSAAMAESPLTLEEIQTLNQSQLDELYTNSHAGIVPNGQSQGRAIFFPGSVLSVPTTVLASLLWQGKVFDRDNGVLLNRVFGFQAIKAQVFTGPSLFDGEEAIIVDYQDTSLLFGPVRDEIRQVGENLYLGRAYIRTLFGAFFGVNFALDFSPVE
jgi:hypothetical protein